MDENKVKPTSVHIPEELLEKANRIASARGISRNRLFVLLLESVEEIAVPPINVTLPAIEVANASN